MWFHQNIWIKTCCECIFNEWTPTKKKWTQMLMNLWKSYFNIHFNLSKVHAEKKQTNKKTQQQQKNVSAHLHTVIRCYFLTMFRYLDSIMLKARDAYALHIIRHTFSAFSCLMYARMMMRFTIQCYCCSCCAFVVTQASFSLFLFRSKSLYKI